MLSHFEKALYGININGIVWNKTSTVARKVNHFAREVNWFVDRSNIHREVKYFVEGSNGA